MRAYFDTGEILRTLTFIACLAFAWFRPQFGDRFFSAVERLGSRLARHRTLAVFSVALATIAIRLSLLWLMPVPVPHVADEFSNLLAGDTFAHGRLTNPTHPMWIYFETIHEIEHPTYMSKYPPAQGLVLALGEVLGNPWIGVLLSAAAMCGLTVWMLQGWFPPQWALLGGVLVVLRLGIFSYWMNSYWGGAVAAIGGALMAGALPRLLRFWRPRDAFILGSGAVILANSRPFEGLIFCLPIFAALLVRLCRTSAASARIILSRVLAPLCIVGLLGGAFMALYNWRGTGNALLTPYAVHEKTYYAGTPLFAWDPVGLRVPNPNPQLESLYGLQSRMRAYNRVRSVSRAIRLALKYAFALSRLFLSPALFVPLLALPWILRRRWFRSHFLQIVLGFIGLLATVWFSPHYFAPLTATICAVLLQGIRYIRQWQIHGRPVGVGLSRVVVLFVALLAPFGQGHLYSGSGQVNGIEYRSLFSSQLHTAPGKQLVIVHYAPDHDFELDFEWVFNDADIDNAKVVWARDIPGVSLHPLLDYFRDRRVWVAEPDTSPPRLTPRDTSNH